MMMMMMMMPTVLLCLAALLCARANGALTCTNRPIIGILTQPTTDDLAQYGKSMLHAGFVKWVEASGMRAVPIQFYSDQGTLANIFSYVNGVLFMGGVTDIITSNTPYYRAAEYLYELTMQANQKGDYIPLWGTCLGFELLAIITSQNFSLMGNTDFASTNVSLALDFTAYAKASRMFGQAPDDIVEKFATQNVTDNEHHNGVTPEEFAENPSLPAFYSVLSTNKDLNGIEFISTMEGRDYPIYGVQWHPERTLYEWYIYQNTNHSIAAVECAQYVGRFFASEARKSCHHFPSQEQEYASLIYNYAPTYTMEVTGGDYEQIYFFN